MPKEADKLMQENVAKNLIGMNSIVNAGQTNVQDKIAMSIRLLVCGFTILMSIY